MSRSIFAFLTAFLLCITSGAQASAASLSRSPDPEPQASKPVYDFSALGAEADQLAKNNGVSGCSIAVFEGEKILFCHSYGTVSVRGGVTTPAAESTKYRVASISKMVTCVLAMTLVEQEKLSLDDELATIIDQRLYSRKWPDDKPTVFHLLTHTSGIIDGAVYNSAIEHTPFPKLETVLGWGSPFSGNKPGTAYAYSNFGLGLVAAAIEHASGEYFYDYADKTLFQPLGLDAGFLTDFIEDKASIAALRGVDPLLWGDMKGCYKTIPKGQMYLLAQGELYISAVDLAKITMILAGDGTYAGVRYLTKESLSLIHKPYIRDDDANVTRGLAVQICPDIVNGVTLYGHQGNAYGAISCVFYDPLTSRGVVFLTNGASNVCAENQVYRVNDEIVRAVWSHL